LKLLLDEMLDHQIAVQLRADGCDAQSIQGDQRDLQATPDRTVLEVAGTLGRSLVTDNIAHFLGAHVGLLAEGKHHAGLLLASPRSYPRDKRTIGLSVRALAAIVREHEGRSTEDLVTWLRTPPEVEGS
jgi:hypothetical protein